MVLTFYINTLTYGRDFLDPDTGASILSEFDSAINTLLVKIVTRGHSLLVKVCDKAVDKVLEPMGLDYAVQTYGDVDIDANGATRKPD